MKDDPRLLDELNTRVLTEASCINYLAKIRWPKGFICSCGSDQYWKTKRGLWHCKECDSQSSVTAGTVFHRSRKPLAIWFRAMWYIVSQKNGTSAQELQNRYEFGSYETAWNWLHKLRRAMVQADGDKLSGCIQTGIACTGGALVAIAAEQKGKEGVGRIRIQQILDTSVENLSNFAKTTITPGSRVITEDFSGYDALPSLGYERRILDPGELILPRGIASLLERWMRNIYRGTIKSSHLAYYLDEFTFRFNFEAERIRGKLFYRLVNKAMILGPVTGDELKASALGT